MFGDDGVDGGPVKSPFPLGDGYCFNPVADEFHEAIDAEQEDETCGGNGMKAGQRGSKGNEACEVTEIDGDFISSSHCRRLQQRRSSTFANKRLTVQCRFGFN
ncbi:hypothetical protein [Rhizobium brockwellii]|uniref:hypothetical protein n=1 Tax=Rhizobium brockwellii TaxID=3019932 RepID=UPI000AA8F977|nr:hypothetical protein [Rhizobium brockwellii]MDV4156557.1 hypothetical protein [Rhizobium brockwellii]